MRDNHNDITIRDINAYYYFDFMQFGNCFVDHGMTFGTVAIL